MKNELPQPNSAVPESVLTTPKNQIESSGRTAAGQPQNGDADHADFESLIHGKFKEAFQERVQKIIDGRFKEMKQLQQQNEALRQQLGQEPPQKENPKKPENKTAEPLPPQAERLSDLQMHKGANPAAALVAAYLEKMMQAPAADSAVQQLAEQLSRRAARPTENGLNGTVGIAAKPSVSGLSPAQRRALAQKALMGEKIGF